LKGDVGSNMIIVLVLAFMAAAVAVGFFSTNLSNADDTLNNTSQSNSLDIDNVSCKGDCREAHPSEGPGYYSCLETNGCS